MNFKNDFKTWVNRIEDYQYINLSGLGTVAGLLESLPFYFKYGVYLQFFESKGVYPMVLPIINDANERMFQVYLDEDHIESFITMELAMDRAIEEAIKFYNKNV